MKTLPPMVVVLVIALTVVMVDLFHTLTFRQMAATAVLMVVAYVVVLAVRTR